MVGLIHYDLPIVSHEFVDLSLSIETLDHSDIDFSGLLPPATANLTDIGYRNIQKHGKPLAPLLHKVPTVHEDERIDLALRNDGRCDHRLSKRRWCTK